MEIVVVACILVIFAATFCTSGYIPVAPFVVSHREVGFLLSAQGLASCITIIPAGRETDKRGGEAMMRLGMWVFSVSLIFTCASTDFFSQLLGRVASGAGGSMLFCAGMVLIMERYQDPLRAKYVGTSIGVGTLGNLAGPPFMGFLYSAAIGSHASMPEAVSFLPAFAVVLLANFARLAIPSLPFAPKALLEKPDEPTGCVRFFGVYAAVGARSWVISFAMFFLFGAETALLCAGTLAMQARGFSPRQIGLLPVPAGALQVLLSHFGGELAGSTRRRVWLMILAPLTLSLCVLAISLLGELRFVGPAVLVSMAVGVAAGAMACADAPSIGLMGDLAKQHGRGYGEAVTATELAVTAGQALGPSVGVLMLQHGGFGNLLLLVACGGGLCSLLCASFLWKMASEDTGDGEDVDTLEKTISPGDQATAAFPKILLS